jgi:adenine-specific DNA-methyltransferase
MVTIDKTYQAYYTKSDPISDYMVSMLNLQPTDTVFEPCGGDGVFIDKILTINSCQKILVYELDPQATSLLEKKYSNYTNVTVKKTDTLLDTSILTHNLRVSKIIGNPPYGAVFSEDVKAKIQKVYKGIYSKESYTLFLYVCIQSLRNGGRLSFIVPDTFLSLHRHKILRELILKYTKIDELLLFPSNFFPGVNFGYANLCIITLERSNNVPMNLANTFCVYKNFTSVNDINRPKKNGIKLVQDKVLHNIDSCFLITDSTSHTDLINGKSSVKVGDIADCVTGFYSGDDKHYLHPISKEIRNSKKYSVVSLDTVHKGTLTEMEKVNGIVGNCFMIPIVKGGNKRYTKPNEWFMDWSNEAVSEYRKSRKCRFQNSSFYFKQGIAIPMVRSRQLTAALINNRLFDQSIVGVFPHDKRWLLYLLGFFNSRACSYAINLINSSTNNSANYIKQLPIIKPTEEIFNEVTSIVKKLECDLNEDAGKRAQDRLDLIFDSLYKFSYRS